MKIRHTAMALLLCCAAAHAEIKLADACVCDVEQSGVNGVDRWMSWAAVDANLIQAWQDVYYDKHDAGETPANGSGTAIGRSGAVYDAFLQGWKLDGCSYIPNGLTWWFQGGEYQMAFGTITAPVNEAKLHADRNSGYYNTVFGNSVLSDDVTDNGAKPCFTDTYGTDFSVRTGNNVGRQVSAAELKDGLDQVFQYKGQAAGLGIYSYDTVNSITTMHALTCWGYETDANGIIQSLYVTDSADGISGLVKLDVYENDSRQYLSSNDRDSLYAKESFCIKSVTGIDTPQGTAQAAANRSILPESGVLTASLALNADTQVSRTVSVGEGLLLAAAQGTGLTITGAEGTGLSVEHSGTAELHGTTLSANSGSGMRVEGIAGVEGQVLSVTQNGDSGLAVGGRMQVQDTEATISSNKTAGNGGGIRIAQGGYLSISAENTLPNLVISGNTAAGRGGAIYNEGSMLIQDLDSVTMEGNSAGQGSAIYNAGRLSIAGIWHTVTISAADGSTTPVIINTASCIMELADCYEGASISGSIRNEGILYLAADEEAPITILGSLESSGTTSIALDAMESVYAGQGVVFTQGENSTAVGSTRDDDGAELRAITLSTGSLQGMGANARLLYGMITADSDFLAADARLDAVEIEAEGTLSLRNVTTAVDSSYTADAIVLDGVTLTLGSPAALLADNDAPAAEYLLDLSGVFNTDTLSGSLTLVQEDLLAAMQASGADTLKVDFGEGVDLANGISLRIQGLQHVGSSGSAAFFSAQVPEPATGTLGLLALAALCARRRARP